MAEAIRRKIDRLRRGRRPRVLDLFAGCGGLSLGFQAAGFEITAAVENEPDAARSHGINFHGGAPEHCKARDILTRPEALTAKLGLGPVADAFDRISKGEARLREWAEVPRASARVRRAKWPLRERATAPHSGLLRRA
jgi:DNA (cytosine-5)-methyltransferase 1